MEAVSYHSVLEKLLPYDQVEAITLDPNQRQQAVIFECYCQALKETNRPLQQSGFPPVMESHGIHFKFWKKIWGGKSHGKSWNFKKPQT